jgi:hypothetical protein
VKTGAASGPSSREELRELAAGAIASMILVTIVGFLGPVTMRLVPDTYEGLTTIGTPSIRFPELLVSLVVGLAAGALGWILLVERRRPVFRIRRRSGLDIAMVFAIVLSYLLPRLLFGMISHAGGLYGLDDNPGVVLSVSAAADDAGLEVLYLAVFTSAYAIGRLALDLRRARHGSAAPIAQAPLAG